MLSHFARVAARASRARAPPLRAMAPAFSTAPAFDPADDELRWEQAFLDATENIVTADASHETSAAALRGLVRSGLLRHTDLRDRPERFFKAHRLLARHAVQVGASLARCLSHAHCAVGVAREARAHQRTPWRGGRGGGSRNQR